MNKTKIAKLVAIRSDLEALNRTLRDFLTDEEEAFDNLSEASQEGDKGSEMQEVISTLESASGSVEEAIEQLETIS